MIIDLDISHLREKIYKFSPYNDDQFEYTLFDKKIGYLMNLIQIFIYQITLLILDLIISILFTIFDLFMIISSLDLHQ